MKQAEGVEILKRMEVAVIKARSITMEVLGIEDPDEDTAGMAVAEGTSPWLFGAASVLMPLHKLNERVRKGEALGIGDFKNMMILAEKEPKIGIAYVARFDGDLSDWRELLFWDDDPELQNYNQRRLAERQSRSEPPLPPEIPEAEEELETEQKEPIVSRRAGMSMFDIPHEMAEVPMMMFSRSNHPLSFQYPGTTISDENGNEIASVSSWLDGSTQVHINNSEYVYLVHVGHILNAVFALEGMNINAWEIPGAQRDSPRPQDFTPPSPKVYDQNGDEISIGDTVVAMIGMNADYFGIDTNRIYIRAGSHGEVVELEEDGGVWVEFVKIDRSIEQRLLVFSQHLAAWGGEDDYE